MTEEQIVAMVLEDARERPLAFIGILTRCLLLRNDGADVLADAMEHLNNVYVADAKALRDERSARGATRAQSLKLVNPTN